MIVNQNYIVGSSSLLHNSSLLKRSLIACSLVSSFFSCENLKQENAPVPTNVILILADDMGLGDLSKVNNSLTETPNLDRLSEESVFFTNAYSASAVSAPARAALLTGRYPHRTGCVTLNPHRFPELCRIKKEEITIANIFKNNGYKTGLIGKWHTGMGEDFHPLNRGFDVFEGFIDHLAVPSYFNYTLNIQGKDYFFDNKYLTDDLTNRAIDFIRNNKEYPFFLHLAHYAPHRPLNAPDSIIEKYILKGLDKNIATVYAMIEIMDNGIGELIKELERLKLRDNTIIIFTSDNGPDPIVGERYNIGLKGTKYEVYDGGIRVPFIFNWPKNVDPMVNNELIHFTDIFPTLVEACNLSIPEDLKLDGGSFLGLLTGKEYLLPEIRIWQWNRGIPYYTHNAAIRKGDWKLVRPPMSINIPETESTVKLQLYNIAEDPGEKVDLSDKYIQEYQTMKVLLEQKFRELEFDRLN